MNNEKNIPPPRVAKWLLRKMSEVTGQRSMRGDVEEEYNVVAGKRGRFRAIIYYWNSIFVSLPSFIKSFIFRSMLMIKSYFKLAWRNLLRNKTSSIINISGLAISIGMSLVLFVMIISPYGTDAFHENADNILAIHTTVEQEWGEQLRGDPPRALGPMLSSDFPEIKRAVRLNYLIGYIGYGQKEFGQLIHFADEGFFDMFTFPAVKGTLNPLSDASSMTISEEIAALLFGDEDPIGKQVTLGFGAADEIKNTRSFIIHSVTAKTPVKASFGFEIVVPYRVYLDILREQSNEWDKSTLATFIQVEEPAEIKRIQSQMKPYADIHDANVPDLPIKSFHFEPLLEMNRNAHKVSNDIVANSAEPALQIVLGVIALMILALPCSNFINISIARSGKRMKEIGMRKVIGGRRVQLICQFMSENVLLCFIALLLGVVLAHSFFVPVWNDLANDNLILDYGGNPFIWVVFLFILVVTGIGAGAYPAFYVSLFRPSNILRGNQKVKTRSLFTRSLLTFQFVLTFFTIAFTIVLINNLTYLEGLDLGYNEDQTITVRVNNERQFTIFKDNIDQNPDIISIAGTRNHIGKSVMDSKIEFQNVVYEVDGMDVGAGYFKTMELQLIEGEIFNARNAEPKNKMIVNETFVTTMGWNSALGKMLTYDKKVYEVIGVVKDFHYFSPAKYMIEPLFLRIVPRSEFSSLVVKVTPGKGKITLRYLEEAWKTVLPEYRYDAYPQNSIYDHYSAQNDDMIKTFSLAASLVLAISCLGLFGLVSMSISNRLKEVSIRKVLGSSVSALINNLNKEFNIILGIAITIAAPASFFFLRVFLDAGWKYHISMGFLPLIQAGALLVFTALLTVFAHVYKTATANPVDALRDE